MSKESIQSIGSERMPSEHTSYPTISYLNVFPESGVKKQVLEEGVCVPLSEEEITAGKQLQLTKFHFRDADGNERISEGVQAAKSVKGSNEKKHDNLCTIAILRRQIMCDCLVLVKQYRAPSKAYTLEFPATVLDDITTPGDLASKEIADDTGYSSTIIKHVSPMTCLEPGEIFMMVNCSWLVW